MSERRDGQSTNEAIDRAGAAGGVPSAGEVEWADFRLLADIPYEDRAWLPVDVIANEAAKKYLGI